MFRSSWKIGKKWILQMGPHGGPTHGFRNWFVCEEFCVNSPLDLGADCKSMQKSFIGEYDLVDISAIESTLDSSIFILKTYSLCGHGPNFG